MSLLTRFILLMDITEEFSLPYLEEKLILFSSTTPGKAPVDLNFKVDPYE